jgi:hypothetical protein
VREDELTLTIRDPGAGFMLEGASDTEIRRVRERLAILYAERAQLTLRLSGDGSSEAVLEIPFQSVAHAVPA